MSTVADLLGSSSLGGDENDERNDLDEEELEVLRKAGIIPEPSVAKGRSKVPQRATKHIVFAESGEQGT